MYLGLTELWLRNDQGAYTYLKLRTQLHSFPEEDYFAWYNFGLATMNLCGKSQNYINGMKRSNII